MGGIGLGLGVQFVTEPIATVVPDVGWLKGTFTADPSAIALAGMSKTISGGYTETAGDYHQTSAKIYLQNTTGGNWDGTDAGGDPVTTAFVYFGYGASADPIAQDTLTEVVTDNSGGAPSAPYNNLYRINWPVSFDKPSVGAVFWVKDIVFKIYNASGVLLFTYTSDFSSGLDGWGPVTSGVVTLEYNQEFLS